MENTSNQRQAHSSSENRYANQFIDLKNNNLQLKKLKSRNIKLKNNKYFELNQILLKIFETSQNSQLFFQQLLKHQYLNSFTTIHFYVHKKGMTDCEHLEIQRDLIKTRTFPVSLFQKFFLAIKKSKNRSFGQKNLKGTPYDIIGTFMAREFTLQDHNIIFALSKDQFLNFEDKEYLSFKNLVNLLPTYLNPMLMQNSLQTDNSLSNIIHHELSKQIEQFNKKVHDEVIHINHTRRLSLLGELLNTFHHEISNPIFGLQLSANLTKNLLEGSEHEELIDLIEQGIKRAQDTLQSFTKLYTNTLENQLIDFPLLFKQILTLSKSELKGISFNLEVDDEVKELDFTSNPTWLAQIAFNLIINSAQAIKEFNSTGEKNISISIKKLSSNIVIDFFDTGPGISEDINNKIFQSFYTTKSNGTGLGLTISKDLAAKLGGKLELISSGPNSFFRLELPR